MHRFSDTPKFLLRRPSRRQLYPSRFCIGHVALLRLKTSPTERETPVRCLSSKMPRNVDFYRFTRARFVCNENHEMSQRYVRYNVDQLARLAAAAVGSKACVGIEKCRDGMHNKVLLLTMDNGIQAIAKVPNPNAGRPHFTTASEVATMDFVRQDDLLYTSFLIKTLIDAKCSWYPGPKSVCLEFYST